MKRFTFGCILFIVLNLGRYGQAQNTILIDTPLEPITLENLNRIEELTVVGLGDVWDIAWSPKGDVLVIATDSGTYVYAKDNLNVPLIRLEQYSTTSVEFDSTGSLLAVGNSLVPVVTVWNTEDWTIKQTFPSWGTSHIFAFSPDSEYLAVGTMGADALCFWELTTGTQVGFVKFVGSGFRSVAFHPNGNDVITTGVNFEKAKIWSFDELKQLYITPIEDKYIRIPQPGLQSTIDENIYRFVIDRSRNLMIGIVKDEIQFRNLDTYELVTALAVPTDYADRVMLSADQQTLIFGYYDELSIWDMDDVLTSEKPKLRKTTIDGGAVFALSPDGTSIVVSNTHTLEVRNLDQSSSVSVDLFQLCGVVPIRIDIVASELSVTGCDKPFRWQLQLPGDAVINAQFHGNSMVDATGPLPQYDVAVRNYDNTTITINLPDWLQNRHINSPILSKDGSWLVLGAPLSGLHFWNAKTGMLVHSIITSDMRNIMLSDDERMLITFGDQIGYYPTMRLWGVPVRE